MNKNVKFALWGVGGLVGFALAYIVFALVLGAQPHQIPVVGAMFPAPPEAAQEAPTVATSTPTNESAPRENERRQNASLLDVFQVNSPYSQAELEALVGELKHKGKELDQRIGDVAAREKRADERAEFLDEQYAELQRLRAGLEQWQDELERRDGEVSAGERARAEREDASWAKLAKIFGEGEVGELGKRLAEYSPGDAAKILHAMKPARAKELLDAVGADRWREYADAYRLLDDPAGN
jgi:flagellar motility protein MotE (MotC chaperone)